MRSGLQPPAWAACTLACVKVVLLNFFILASRPAGRRAAAAAAYCPDSGICLDRLGAGSIKPRPASH